MISIHGHFYQPPRENPWLGRIPRERTAAPFHDWNTRITAECYRPNAGARRLATDGWAVEIVDNYSRMSFDFGPTLMSWLEALAPDVHDAVVEADRRSIERFGAGAAMAHPYHHAILPLSSQRDRLTEIRWGIADFRRRFRRDPEGFWLPETAVDAATLADLAAEGLRFVVLAPHQVDRGPGLYRHASGLAVFVYDGPISRAVAFERLLDDGTAFARRMAASRPGPTMVATDGETYGHHHRHGEMALATALHVLDRDGLLAIPAAQLAANPPTEPVQVRDQTAWSCAHGLGRWTRDCGCRTRTDRHQRWRGPLRDALDALRDRLAEPWAIAMGELVDDPWVTRDAWQADPHALDAVREPVRARSLLQLQRALLAMYTSCGWFFDDVAGLETAQVIRYAAYAADLAGALLGDRGALPELARALESAVGFEGTGRDVVDAQLRHHRVDAERVAAQAAAVAVWGRRPAPARIGHWYLSPAERGFSVLHAPTGQVTEVVVTSDVPDPGELDLEERDAALASVFEDVRAQVAARARTAFFEHEALVAAIDPEVDGRPGPVRALRGLVVEDDLAALLRDRDANAAEVALLWRDVERWELRPDLDRLRAAAQSAIDRLVADRDLERLAAKIEVSAVLSPELAAASRLAWDRRRDPAAIALLRALRIRPG